MLDIPYLGYFLRLVLNSFKDNTWLLSAVAKIIVLAALAERAIIHIGYADSHGQQFDRAVILAIIAMLLIGGYWREHHVRRGNRFANAQEKIHEINHLCRDLITFLDEILTAQNGPSRPRQQEMKAAKKAANQALSEILSEFATTFNVISGVSCRASVKGIHSDNDTLYIYTLARDRNSQRFFEREDDKRNKQLQDRLEDNSDFQTIFDPELVDRWYFENYLPKNEAYTNSKDPDLADRRNSQTKFTRRFLPRSFWRLPYVATIVWPIQQGESDRLALDPLGCIGFLTIDSPRKDTFDKRTDPYLGGAIADGLFHVILRLVMLNGMLENSDNSEDAC